MYGIEGLLAGHTLIGRYRIEEVIGRGGMGAVYRALDGRLGRPVAVKVITVAASDAAEHEQLRARFQREARAAAALQHASVVQVFDFGTDPALGLDFLVMELLRGEDLATRLARKGPPAVATTLEILHQAARGLAAGHRAGLIHRDVKPGNLFLEPGDHPGEVVVKVLDFGIAELLADGDRTVTHLTVAGRSPFSPAFASPEQLRGLTLTPATDVFSLAAVGFQLLTGKRAFASTDPQRMLVELSGALAAELPRVRGLAPEARDVLRRALAPDPRDRYPDAAVLAEALAPFVHAPRRRLSDAEEDERTVFMPAHRAAPSAPAAAPEQGGWLSRAGRAAWNLTVTATCVALFGGSWLATFGALDHGLLQRIYAATTLSVLLAPLAVHRLLGGRGSFRFALLGSIAGSVAAVYLLARHGSIETVLTGVLAAQLVASYAGERLTRREE